MQLTEKINIMQSQNEQQHRTIANLQQQISILQKWRGAAYSDSETGYKTDNQWHCMVSLELPRKSGKFMCRYSFTGYADKGIVRRVGVDCGRSIDYRFDLGVKRLLKQDSVYLSERHKHKYGLPLSGSVVVELNGDENINRRTLKLCHKGCESFPSGMRKPCIEAWEL